MRSARGKQSILPNPSSSLRPLACSFIWLPASAAGVWDVERWSLRCVSDFWWRCSVTE
jgi:hypothetical protein